MFETVLYLICILVGLVSITSLCWSTYRLFGAMKDDIRRREEEMHGRLVNKRISER